MWIDAHSHVWFPDTARYPLRVGLTAKDLDPPSFTDAELLAVAAKSGVDRVVLIQHTVYYRFDNGPLVETIRRNPGRFRAVAMVDDRGADPAGEMRALLPQGATGFRITSFIRKPDRDGWLDTPGMHAMWATAAETRQSMCCLVDPFELPAVDAMCERYPDTPVVIDHLGRVGADGQIREADIAQLVGLARHAQVSVKVSGFYALGAKRPPYLDLVPQIRRVYEAFGPQRLMWGSDSPYQLREGQGYAESLALIGDALGFMSDADRDWLLRGTAERVFFCA